jgi:hypothetical protein
MCLPLVHAWPTVAFAPNRLRGMQTILKRPNPSPEICRPIAIGLTDIAASVHPIGQVVSLRRQRQALRRSIALQTARTGSDLRLQTRFCLSGAGDGMSRTTIPVSRMTILVSRMTILVSRMTMLVSHLGHRLSRLGHPLLDSRRRLSVLRRMGVWTVTQLFRGLFGAIAFRFRVARDETLGRGRLPHKLGAPNADAVRRLAPAVTQYRCHFEYRCQECVQYGHEQLRILVASKVRFPAAGFRTVGRKWLP